MSPSLLGKWLWQMITSPWLILALILASQWPTSWLSMGIFGLSLYYMIRSWAVLESPIPNPDQLKVVIVGAGVAGMGMARKLKEVGVEDFVLLEKNDDIGGTWWLNRYPGVACDIFSHFYSYSYFMNAKWSKAYSEGQEIWDYLNRFAEEFQLRPHIHFKTVVSKTIWQEDQKKWLVRTKDGKEYQANIFISAVGALHTPSKPHFKNQEAFQKPIFHTAEWDKSVDLVGKRVGVIGTGASGVQAVANIADKVKELYVFQRTAAWVPARMNFTHWNWIKECFASFPFVHRLFRNMLFLLNEVIYFAIFTLASPIRNLAERAIAGAMRNTIQKEKEEDNEFLKTTLVPKYALGCKRITPSDDYIQTFNKPHVHLIQDRIESFNETGIATSNGKNIDLDVIILATGFDVLQSSRAFHGIGKGGQVLAEVWGDCPRAYLGITHPGFPNSFILLGPGTGLGHSSIIFMIECQVNYIIDCMRKLQISGQKAMTVKKSVHDGFVTWLDESIKNRVFGSGGCVAWYQNAKGVNWTLWPKDLITYWSRTYSCEMSDYELE